MLQSDIPGVHNSSSVRKRSLSGNPSVGARDNSANKQSYPSSGTPNDKIEPLNRSSLDAHHYSQEDISLRSDSGCPSTESSAASGKSGTSSASSAENKSRKSSGSSSSGCSMKMVSPDNNNKPASTSSSLTSNSSAFNVPSRIKNFMDNFTSHRQRTKSLATPPSSKYYESVTSKSDEVFVSTPPSSRPCSHPQGCTRRHHNSGGSCSEKYQRSSQKPFISLAPLSVTTNSSSTPNSKMNSSNSPCCETACSTNAPLSPTGLETIPQGQELSTGTPPQRFHYNAPTSSTPRTRSNSGNASPAFSASPMTSSSPSAPPPKIKKRSKSPLGGRIITRLRSLSMSDDISPSSEMPGLIDPSKLPKQEAKSYISFAPLGCRYNRFKKLSQQVLGHSDGDADLLRHERPKSIHSTSEGEDRLLTGLSIDSSFIRFNRLERALSLHPDKTTDQGTAMTAMAFGVRRVAENKRFIMLSKSSLRTPDDYLGLGTEYLGDNFVYATFFHHSTCYDLLPDSAKLVVLDSKLQVGRAFRALHFNGIRAAPLWSSDLQKFVGMLTVTDFIRVLRIYHENPDMNIDELEEQTIDKWREMLKTTQLPLQSIQPEDSLFRALSLISRPASGRRLPIVDLRSGNVLYLLSSRRMLHYLHLKQGELPIPAFLNKTIGDIRNSSNETLGTFGESSMLCMTSSSEQNSPLSDDMSFKSFPSDDGIKKELISVRLTSQVIEALALLDKHHFSALPVLNEKNQLVDVYAKLEVMTMASRGTYKNLDITIEESLKDSKKFEFDDSTCLITDTVRKIFDKFIFKTKRRLFVIDSPEQRHLIGVITATDLLRYLVLQHIPPPHSLRPISEHAPASVRRSVSLDQSSVSPDSSNQFRLRHSRSVSINQETPVTLESDNGRNSSLLKDGSSTSAQDEDLFKMDIV